MGIFLTLAYLFAIGAMIGWILELFFRRFFSDSNPERKWINPGFCVGPYIPLYGFGLCILYLLSSLEWYLPIDHSVLRKGVLVLSMTISLTLIEYLAGWICLKLFKVRLWDYSRVKGNIQGLICPMFSFFWGVLGLLYLLLIHTHILALLAWLSGRLTLCFALGMFYGVFAVDVVYSSNLISKIKKYAKENDIVVKWERLKNELKEKAERLGEKSSFLFPMKFHRLITDLRDRVKKEDSDSKSKNE